MLIVERLGGFMLGRKFLETRALGMTETVNGSKAARRTVFSLLELN